MYLYLIILDCSFTSVEEKIGWITARQSYIWCWEVEATLPSFCQECFVDVWILRWMPFHVKMGFLECLFQENRVCCELTYEPSSLSIKQSMFWTHIWTIFTARLFLFVLDGLGKTIDLTIMFWFHIWILFI